MEVIRGAERVTGKPIKQHMGRDGLEPRRALRPAARRQDRRGIAVAFRRARDNSRVA